MKFLCPGRSGVSAEGLGFAGERRSAIQMPSGQPDCCKKYPPTIEKYPAPGPMIPEICTATRPCTAPRRVFLGDNIGNNEVQPVRYTQNRPDRNTPSAQGKIQPVSDPTRSPRHKQGQTSSPRQFVCGPNQSATARRKRSKKTATRCGGHTKHSRRSR